MNVALPARVMAGMLSLLTIAAVTKKRARSDARSSSKFSACAVKAQVEWRSPMPTDPRAEARRLAEAVIELFRRAVDPFLAERDRLREERDAAVARADEWRDHVDRAVKRAEEAEAWVSDLQSGMYVNCVYCGHRYGPGETTPVSMADALKEHIERCPKHPLSAARERIASLEAQLAVAREIVAELDSKRTIYTQPWDAWERARAWLDKTP